MGLGVHYVGHKAVGEERDGHTLPPAMAREGARMTLPPTEVREGARMKPRPPRPGRATIRVGEG